MSEQGTTASSGGKSKEIRVYNIRDPKHVKEIADCLLHALQRRPVLAQA
jgi:hypothetical protein